MDEIKSEQTPSEEKIGFSQFFFDTHPQIWRILSFYERFEQVVSVILTMIISIVIVYALFALAHEVFYDLLLGGKDPLEHATFQRIFGMIMAVLTTVILIALLAIARKLIILDFEHSSPAWLASLSLSVLALGIAYWLLRR